MLSLCGAGRVPVPAPAACVHPSGPAEGAAEGPRRDSVRAACGLRWPCAGCCACPGAATCTCLQLGLLLHGPLGICCALGIGECVRPPSPPSPPLLLLLIAPLLLGCRPKAAAAAAAASAAALVGPGLGLRRASAACDRRGGDGDGAAASLAGAACLCTEVPAHGLGLCMHGAARGGCDDADDVWALA